MWPRRLMVALLWHHAIQSSHASARGPSEAPPVPDGGRSNLARAHYSPYSSRTFPDVNKDPKACNGPHATLLCDPDALLSRHEAAKVDRLVTQIELADPPYAASSCSQTGYQARGGVGG